MSAVNVDTFNDYISQFEDDTNGLKQIYLDSAEAMIIDYIGYDFNLIEYEEVLDGTDLNYILLSAYPVTALTSVTIDDQIIDIANFSIKREKLTYVKNIFKASSVIALEYTAGYSDAPGIVQMVELQIAALLFTEASGNIGVTSKSFDGGNSRTFIKTTNFAPYLQKLDSMRVKQWN